jgi:hypothetical protein
LQNSPFFGPLSGIRLNQVGLVGESHLAGPIVPRC